MTIRLQTKNASFPIFLSYVAVIYVEVIYTCIPENDLLVTLAMLFISQEQNSTCGFGLLDGAFNFLSQASKMEFNYVF